MHGLNNCAQFNWLRLQQTTTCYAESNDTSMRKHI